MQNRNNSEAPNGINMLHSVPRKKHDSSILSEILGCKAMPIPVQSSDLQYLLYYLK